MEEVDEMSEEISMKPCPFCAGEGLLLGYPYAITARIRELRAPRSPNRMAYDVQTRKAPNSNAFEYYIAKGRKK
jgi:hypothetical protein